MMRSLLLIYFALYYAICSAQAKTPSLDYTRLLSERVTNEEELRWVVDHIENNDYQSLLEISEVLKRYSEDFKRIGHSRIANILGSLASQNRNSGKHPIECSGREAKQFIDLTTIAFGNLEKYISLVSTSNQLPERVQKLLNFLNWHSNSIWRECLKPEVIKSMFISLINGLDLQAEEALDSLFTSTEFYHQDDVAATKAEKMDFTDSQMDGFSMFSSMSDFLKKKNPSARINSYRMVEFIESNCKVLYPKLSQFFDGYNLARALFNEEPKVEEENSTRFNKLNEYSRLCGQILRPSSAQIAVANIARSMPRIFQR